MAVHSVVKLSDFNDPNRVDAEYYQPKYINVVAALQTAGAKPLSEAASVLRGRNPSKYTDLGVPVIRAIDLRDLTDLSNALCADPAEKLFYLADGDILISSIGAGSIGKVGVFRNGTFKAATVSEVSVIRIKNGPYQPGALAVFLLSRYGYLQLERRITGSTGQQHLYPKDIKSVLIPDLDITIHGEISNAYDDAMKLIAESRSSYLEAQDAMLQGLGWQAITAPQPRSWSVAISGLMGAQRFDAEYFRPRHQSAMAYMSQSGSTIRDVAKLAKRRFKPVVGSAFSYLEIGDLGGGFTDGGVVMGEDAPSRATWIVRASDVITSTVRPIRRLSAIIEDDQDGFVCSSGFAVLEPKNIEPEVLLVYLRLPIVCEILDLYTTASMYPAISTSNLMAIPISLPSTDVRNKVVSGVQSSMESRRKAKIILQQATSKLEAFIEARTASTRTRRGNSTR